MANVFVRPSPRMLKAHGNASRETLHPDLAEKGGAANLEEKGRASAAASEAEDAALLKSSTPTPAAGEKAVPQNTPELDAKLDPLKKRYEELQSKYLEESPKAYPPEHKKHKRYRFWMPGSYANHMKRVEADSLKAQGVIAQIDNDMQMMDRLLKSGANLQSPGGTGLGYGMSESQYAGLQTQHSQLGGTSYDPETGERMSAQELVEDIGRLKAEEERVKDEAVRFETSYAEYAEIIKEFPQFSFPIPFREDGDPDIEALEGKMAELRTKATKEIPKQRMREQIEEASQRWDMTPVYDENGEIDIDASQLKIEELVEDERLRKQQLTISRAVAQASNGIHPPAWLEGKDPNMYASAIRRYEAWYTNQERLKEQLAANVRKSGALADLYELELKEQKEGLSTAEFDRLDEMLAFVQAQVTQSKLNVAALQRDASGFFQQFGLPGGDTEKLAIWENHLADMEAKLQVLLPMWQRGAEGARMRIDQQTTTDKGEETASPVDVSNGWHSGGKSLDAATAKRVVDEYRKDYLRDEGEEPPEEALRAMLDYATQAGGQEMAGHE